MCALTWLEPMDTQGTSWSPQIIISQGNDLPSEESSFSVEESPFLHKNRLVLLAHSTKGVVPQDISAVNEGGALLTAGIKRTGVVALVVCVLDQLSSEEKTRVKWSKIEAKWTEK